MKTLTLIISILFLSNYSFGQDTKVYKKKYDNGVVKLTGSFIEGLGKTGKWREFYPSGNIKVVREFQNDTLNGIVTGYFENGQISSTGKAYDWNKEGEWRAYYESGELRLIENFIDGIKHGKNIAFFKNGNKEMETFFKNGSQVGKIIYYDESGVKTREKYKNDEGDYISTFFEYYDNGQIMTVEKKLNGFLFFGKQLAYYENGQINYVGNYNKDGNLHGKEEIFYENGEMKTLKIWENGNLISKKEFSKE